MNRRPLLLTTAAVLVVTAGFDLPQCGGEQQAGRVAYGTVEATEVQLAAVLGGTVLEVTKREGDTVQQGELLVRLDTDELNLQLKQAESQLRAAQAREQLTRRAVQREDVRNAEQALKLATVQLESAERNLARVDALRQKGALTDQQFDDSRAARDMAQARMDQAQAVLDKVVKGARSEEVDMARAAREQAESAIALSKKRLEYGTLKAPIDGRVLYRHVEQGEVARPGVALLTLADITRLHVDVYVPEGDLGAVTLGAELPVLVDAFPSKPFAGRVAHLSEQAEFTPKNVQTREQRARLVFRVRLDVANPDGALKAGMPAEAHLDGLPQATAPGATP